MLELREVWKHYGNQPIIRGLNLHVDTGETLVMIGPSGCGKSTTLRLMLGLATPDRGAVVFDGQTLAPANVEEIRRRVGYVIQDGGLFPHLTARRNVTLMARHARWTPEKIRDRLAELCELTSFPADGLDRYPIELSGGQRQRVALMRALMLDPDVLLMDEPLGALDPMIRYELQQELRWIFRELQKTVILVTHDLAEAAYFSDRLLLMHEGAVVQRGPLHEMTDRPSDPFVTRFVQAQRGPEMEPAEAAS